VSGREDVVCARCELADGFWKRFKGLLGRSALAPDEGLLLRPAAAVHTFFLRFPIDVVFIDRGGCVVDVEERVARGRLLARARARAVLELPAGAWRRVDGRVGDRLRYCPPPRHASRRERSGRWVT
jgi:hypothetical protein